MKKLDRTIYSNLNDAKIRCLIFDMIDIDIWFFIRYLKILVIE